MVVLLEGSHLSTEKRWSSVRVTIGLLVTSLTKALLPRSFSLARQPALAILSTDNSIDFMAWFVLWHALLTVGPYIDRCVPFQIMSNQLNLPQVDSNQVVETSQG